MFTKLLEGFRLLPEYLEGFCTVWTDIETQVTNVTSIKFIYVFKIKKRIIPDWANKTHLKKNKWENRKTEKYLTGVKEKSSEKRDIKCIRYYFCAKNCILESYKN